MVEGILLVFLINFVIGTLVIPLVDTRDGGVVKWLLRDPTYGVLSGLMITLWPVLIGFMLYWRRND